jgi:MYXO-CTERM domain-containing protein
VVPAWALSGVLLTVGLGAAFTPWVLLSVPALGLVLLLGLRCGFDRRAWTALAGAAWLPLWLAWLDRSGPGDVCTGSTEAMSCSTTGDPWPWLGAGVLMVVAALVLALRRSR